MEERDWRLQGQEGYLAGARLRFTEYRPPSATWDHDHCAFCTRKISNRVGEDIAQYGWQTEDGYDWICDACFVDFRKQLGFVEVEAGAPLRGVELHDAMVLEVSDRHGIIVVQLEAFVHDDWESESGAGCWQRIDMSFREAIFERRGSDDGRVFDGSVRIDDRLVDNVLPIPFSEKGQIIAILTGADFELTVRGHGVWVQVTGAPGEREG